MVPPVLQQVLLLIESLLRALEAEVCPPRRILGIPLFRLPSPRTRAAAQLRRLANEIAALAAKLPYRPIPVPTPNQAPQAKFPLPTREASHIAMRRAPTPAPLSPDPAPFLKTGPTNFAKAMSARPPSHVQIVPVSQRYAATSSSCSLAPQAFTRSTSNPTTAATKNKWVPRAVWPLAGPGQSPGLPSSSATR